MSKQTPEGKNSETINTASTSMPAVEFTDVTLAYGNRVILSNVSMKIPKNQTTVLLGPSGAGKSTMIRLAVGLLKPTSGSVSVLGSTLQSISEAELLALRRRFGMLFQEGALFGSLTVEQNIGFPLKHILRLDGDAYHERVLLLMRQMGLEGLESRLPNALSGGQRKRVAFARAIALEPEIVFFDEPTSGLDPQTSASIDDLINEMRAKLNLTFIVITHDVSSARAIADNIGIVFDSKLHRFGPRDVIWQDQDPKIRSFLDRKALHIDQPPEGADT